MKQKYSIPFITAFSLAGILIFIVYNKQSSSQKLYTTHQSTKIINDVYKDMSGFSIVEQERKTIEDAGGNATYGEIKPESIAQLLHYLKFHYEDVFFDLGSGIGKACVQVVLTTPAKAVGIELSDTRHHIAQKAKEELLTKNILIDTNKLLFFNENILNADLSEGTVFFLCSTCFSDELMFSITKKLAALNKMIRVATLRQLADTGDFELIKTFNLPMTWSASSSVYIYKRK